MMHKIRNIAVDTRGFTIVELMIATVVFSLVMVICLVGMVQVSRAYYKGITISKTQEAGRFLMDEISSTIQFSGSSINPNNDGTVVAMPVNVGFPSNSFVNNGVTDPSVFNDGGFGVFCAGNKKYSYALDKKVVSTDDEIAPISSEKSAYYSLISEDAECLTVMLPTNVFGSNAVLTGVNAKSLLSENMRLTKFSVTRIIPDDSMGDTINSGSQIWKIDISIAYGDDDLIQYFDDSGNNRVTCRPDTGSEFCAIVELSKIVTRRIG